MAKLVNNCFLITVFLLIYRKVSALFGFADYLKVLGDEIARVLNMPDATLAVAKDFEKVWHDNFLQKFQHYAFSGRNSKIASAFLTNKRLFAVSNGKFQRILCRCWGSIRL